MEAASTKYMVVFWCIINHARLWKNPLGKSKDMTKDVKKNNEALKENNTVQCPLSHINSDNGYNQIKPFLYYMKFNIHVYNQSMEKW